MSSTMPRGRNHLTVLIVLAALAAGLGLWLGNRYAATTSGPKLASALVYPAPRALPDFKLVQANGAALTLADWRGHWNLVYFGYASCPDVCPTTLQSLKSAWAELKRRGVAERVRVSFVSVDPERDTPEALGKYAAFFSPDFLAATGSDEELTRISRALGLVYTRTRKTDGTIEVDHSGSVVIVDPQAQLVGLFRPPFDAAKLAADTATLAATPSP